jgi:hypothetical protein
MGRLGLLYRSPSKNLELTLFSKYIPYKLYFLVRFFLDVKLFKRLKSCQVQVSNYISSEIAFVLRRTCLGLLVYINLKHYQSRSKFLNLIRILRAQ